MKPRMEANKSKTKCKRNDEGDEILIRKQTIDKLLRHKCSDDMIALYVFLSYTALWQRTNQPHATVSFIAKGLSWGVNKVRRIKALLAQRGMIEDLCSVDPQSKQITGWHVRVSYFHPHGFREGGNDKPPSRFRHSVDSRPPNAFRSDNTRARGNASRAGTGTARMKKNVSSSTRNSSLAEEGDGFNQQTGEYQW